MAMPLHLPESARLEAFYNAVHAQFETFPPRSDARRLSESILNLEFSQDELLDNGEEWIFGRVAQFTNEDCRYCKHRKLHVQTNHDRNHGHIEVMAYCSNLPFKCPKGLPTPVSDADKPTPVEGIDVGSW